MVINCNFHSKEGIMTRFIASTIAAVLFTLTLAPAFAAPGDHNLKTSEGIKAFWEEQGNRTGGGGGD
jgi:hypothetical protein